MPVMAPALRAGDHVDDDAALLKGLKHPQVGHAAGGSAAEGHANAHATEVVNQPFHAVGQSWAPGRSRRGFADFEIANREVAKLRCGASNRVPVLQEPDNADFITPPARRNIQRLQAAKRRITCGRWYKVNRAIDEFHQPDRPARFQIRLNVEDNAVGVLPFELPAGGSRPVPACDHSCEGADAERPAGPASGLNR